MDDNADQIFRFVIHISTVQRLEKLTKKRYSHNGDKMINEALTKLQKSEK